MEISQSDIGKILTDKYLLIKQRNNRYSLRSFAKKLEISSGALSRIIAGKRNVSFEMAKSFSEKLSLSEEEQAVFMRSFHVEDLIEKGIEYKKLDTETTYTLSFNHFSMLNLIKTDSFKNDNAFIAKRLGISIEQAELIKKQLIKSNLVIEDKDGNLKRTSENVSTPDMQSLDFIKKLQRVNLEKAAGALDLDIEKRDITAMTMTINPDRIDEARKLIRKFQNDLSVLLENDEKKKFINCVFSSSQYRFSMDDVFMKKVLACMFLLFFISTQANARGDFEGNGGDTRRLVYAIYYHSIDQTNSQEFIKLPKPSAVKTNIYNSDNEAFENILFGSGLENTPFAMRMKKEMNCIYKRLTLHTFNYRTASDLSRDFYSMTYFVQDTFSLTSLQSQKLSSMRVNIVKEELFDRFGGRVCAIANGEVDAIILSEKCLLQENHFMIKILLVHEILRVLGIMDDEYQNTYKVFREKFSFIPAVINQCVQLKL